MKKFKWINVFLMLLFIICIFLTFILIILLEQYGFLYKGFQFFLIIFLVFILLSIVKTYIDINSNKKGINIFKKYNKINEIDLFMSDIKRMPTYKKIIKSENGIILIDEAGIFEIRFINERGILKGNINESKWYIKKKVINNPFILKGDNIIRYLVLTRNLIPQVAGIRLVTKYSLVFTLEKHLNKKILTEEQIDKEYEIYGGNKN